MINMHLTAPCASSTGSQSSNLPSIGRRRPVKQTSAADAVTCQLGACSLALSSHSPHDGWANEMILAPLPICGRREFHTLAAAKQGKHYERQQVRGLGSCQEAPPLLSHSCTVLPLRWQLVHIRAPPRRQLICTFSATFLSSFSRRSSPATQQRSAIPVAFGHSIKGHLDIRTIFTF